jgi:hypothetical protein
LNDPPPSDLETDPRFPSGPWVGYFLQKTIPGRHQMEIQLTFKAGQLRGEGHDWVGQFVMRGSYNLEDGKCYWTKRYLGKHDVYYQGFNEGKGIWGSWEIPFLFMRFHGGFHIWPKGMAEHSQAELFAEADLPQVIHESLEPSESELVPSLD